MFRGTPGASAPVAKPGDAFDARRRQDDIDPSTWPLIWDAIDDPMFLHDKVFRLLAANRAYYQAAGVTAGTALGKPYWEVFPPGDGPPVLCHAVGEHHCAHCHQEVHVGARVYTSRGGPVRQDAEQSLHVLHDITELKQAVAALRARESWANLILDTAPEAMLVVGARGHVARANAAAERLFGYPTGAMTGLPVEALIPERFHAAHHGHRHSFDANPHARGMGKARDLRALRRDGSEFSAEIGLGPMRIDDASYVVVSVLDISAQVEADAARATALEAAEHLARARSEFLANMSHEIRTPLNGVLGLAQVGQRECIGRDAHAIFSRILDSGQHLLAVVDDILDYSKIEAGKLRIEREPIDLARVIDRVVELTAERAHAKRLAFRVHKAPDLPAGCLGDALRLSQVLINLLNNAVKFTELGGITLEALRVGNGLVFRVIDTGIGMNEEQIARLFTAFEQADGSTTRRFGGSGLGLAISKRLVEMMAGEIRVKSVPGAGSLFEIGLPLDVCLPPQRALNKAVSGGRRLVGLAILAAEDNEVNRLVLRELLMHEGARLHCVEDGMQAVEQVRTAGMAAWDILLTDIQMPGLDGYETARRVAALDPTLPIVGLTAHALPEERGKCLAAGMLEHVSKPFDIDVLVAIILRHARRQPLPPATMTPPTTPPSATPLAPETGVDVVNWANLESQFGGRRAFVDKLAATALDNCARLSTGLRQATTAVDHNGIATVCHQLKATAGNLMATRLFDLARQAEQAAREGRADSVELAERVVDALGYLQASLRRRLGVVDGKQA